MVVAGQLTASIRSITPIRTSDDLGSARLVTVVITVRYKAQYTAWIRKMRILFIMSVLKVSSSGTKIHSSKASRQQFYANALILSANRTFPPTTIAVVG